MVVLAKHFTIDAAKAVVRLSLADFDGDVPWDMVEESLKLGRISGSIFIRD